MYAKSSGNSISLSSLIPAFSPISTSGCCLSIAMFCKMQQAVTTLATVSVVRRQQPLVDPKIAHLRFKLPKACSMMQRVFFCAALKCRCAGVPGFKYGVRSHRLHGYPLSARINPILPLSNDLHKSFCRKMKLSWH